MKVVLQDGFKDCGICCLLSIIRFYGGEVPKEYLRELTHTTKDGVSLYNLMDSAGKLGFEAMGVYSNIKNLNASNLPCIAHINVNKSFKHFVVLYEINEVKQSVVLMDPAKGKKIISISEYNLLSSGNYLLLKPIKKLPIMKKKNIVYKNIKKNILCSKKTLLLISFLTISYFLFNILSSFHFKYILELCINYNLSNDIFLLSLIMIFIYIFKNTNLLIRNLLLNKWLLIFDCNLTFLTYKQVLLLPYFYYKNRTVGEIISRFKDLNTIRSYLGNFFCIISTDCFSFFLFLIIMFYYSKRLTVLLIIPIIFIILFIVLTANRKKELIRKMISKEDNINSYLIEGISNVDTIKGSHLEKKYFDKFLINYKNYLSSVYIFNKFFEIYNFIKTNMNDFIYILIFGIGSVFVIHLKITLGTLIVYQTFFSYFYSSFYKILSVFEDYSSYKISLDRIEEIFMVHSDNFSNNYYYLPYTLDGNIIYNNLCYKIGNKILFSNLNLTIKKGEKILLSGASGSGKSTLLKLLVRYIDIDYGYLSINNIDINHYHLENIRSNISYISNNEYLFYDTIKNNILVGLECNNEEFINICGICCVDDIIKTKMLGYDMIIEENGFNISNGERQRIILARSLLRNSKIYIYDEAFSGIDRDREKVILERIFKYYNDRTIIVISHRFNNKKLFDRVLKLENGKIYETKKL